MKKQNILDTIYAKAPDVVVRIIGSDTVLVPISKNLSDDSFLYSLNKTGAEIFSMIDGSLNVRDIATKFSESFNVDKKKVLADVACLFDDLLKNTLIVKAK